MNTIRAFIAIEIPETIQARLDQVISDLKKQDREHVLHWSQAKNIHITLKFLGETPLSKLESLSQILAEQAARQAPFDINLGGLGAFPAPARPRVFWMGMEAPPRLAILQKEIEQAVIPLGFPAEERAFTPHLTLARVAQNATRDQIAQTGTLMTTWIKSAPKTLGLIHVHQVAIFRSDLRPGGAVYTRMGSASLAAASADRPLSP